MEEGIPINHKPLKTNSSPDHHPKPWSLETRIAPNTPSKTSTDGGAFTDVEDGYMTPTSEVHRIPVMLECPTAPRKKRIFNGNDDDECPTATCKTSSSSDSTADVDDEGYVTPTSEEYRIKPMKECPPAPRKKRMRRREVDNCYGNYHNRRRICLSFSYPGFLDIVVESEDKEIRHGKN